MKNTLQRRCGRSRNTLHYIGGCWIRGENRGIFAIRLELQFRLMYSSRGIGARLLTNLDILTSYHLSLILNIFQSTHLQTVEMHFSETKNFSKAQNNRVKTDDRRLYGDVGTMGGKLRTRIL